MHDNPAYQELYQEEIINGEIVLISPAMTNQNLISGNIFLIFQEYLRGTDTVVFSSGEAVFFSPENRFIPDGMVVW